MWLINTTTFQLEEFLDETVQPYAILSHRWQGNEVSFQDMQNLEVAFAMKSFAKIQRACETAAINGNSYLWMDSCCIDKQSSAALTEAINSMYRWYKASAVCHVFLFDVDAEEGIRSSEWFTRGWTLQELIAPVNLVFYDSSWQCLGTKQTLSKVLAEKTGIDERVLKGRALSKYSIAQRMSWASNRVTTRTEDMAYSLLGIFDVSMPMLYGEGGQRAFFRLQVEIIKESDDHSMFAWSIHRNGQPGLLADSPASFANCRNTVPITSQRGEGHSPYSLTNRGLSIKLMAAHFIADTYVVRLDCMDGISLADSIPANEYRLGMLLRRLGDDDQYARVRHKGETFIRLQASTWDVDTDLSSDIHRPVRQIEIYVRQEYTGPDDIGPKERINGFRIATPELLDIHSLREKNFRIRAGEWDPEECIIFASPTNIRRGLVFDFSKQDRKIKAIKLGFDFDFNPVCFVSAASGLGETHWTTEYEPILDPFDAPDWSFVRGRVATMSTKYKGLWALKGDRIIGLTVRLAENPGSSDFQATLRIVRGEVRGRLVWDVYLENIKKKRALRNIFN